MRRALKRSTLAVAVFATAGLGLLGASVQGIAAVDGDLQAAVREHRVEQQRQHVRDGVRRDCPKPRVRRAPSSLKS